MTLQEYWRSGSEMLCTLILIHIPPSYIFFPIKPWYQPPPLLRQPITNKRLNTMRIRTEAPKLHSLPAGDLLGVAVPPLNRHLRVGIGVDEHIEGAVARELREEGDGGGDLTEDGGDLVLDFFLGLFGGWLRGGSTAVFVGGGRG